jgi:IS5 family transposase
MSSQNDSASEPGKAERRDSIERQLTGQAPPKDSTNPNVEENPAERAPDSVGDSVTRSAEKVAKHEDEPGRDDTGTKGPTERPVGTSDERDMTSVDPG